MARTSQFQINKMELIPRSLFEQSVENQVFTNNRLRLWFSGLCISLSQDRKLVAVYCDPNKIQSYINENLDRGPREDYPARGWCLVLCRQVCGDEGG